MENTTDIDTLTLLSKSYTPTESGFDLIWPSSQSSKHICIFVLYDAV